ncbi:unnamed protein product [Ceutorhynchus assimilis]|uniref:MADF domain-containing protein n=1 Tax=Ceutorhynchus assimilis TaxID=467358 RepID=A0A9N9MCX2_9CUCU|nr:unnamed protein product [Ceutorhynchus assimilis]
MEKQSQQQIYENFIRKLIKSYEANPALWKKEDPNYKSRESREKAMNNLLEVACEFFPDANMDFVKGKLENIKGGFRREHKKVTESKRKAKHDGDIYVPALWYYNHLLFLVGEQYKGDEIEEFKDNSRNLYAWTKPNTVILIDLLRKYPILYTNECTMKGNKSKRVKAYDDITNELNAAIESNFAMLEVKLKINTLKQQFRRECRRKVDKRAKMLSSLWCYDLLLFLKDSPMSVNQKVEQISSENEDDDDLEETMTPDCEDQVEQENETTHLENDQDDIYDIIGKNVAMKLRDMSDDQRLHAEQLLNTVMYHGLMEHLTSDTELCFQNFN